MDDDRKAPTIPVKPHGLLWAVLAVLAALGATLLIYALIFYTE